MKSEFLYRSENLYKKVRAGKSVFLPDYQIDVVTGDWIEVQIEIKTESELDAYIAKHQNMKNFLEASGSKTAGKIYTRAIYTLTSPANTTIAGNLLSGKKLSSGEFYTTGNIPQARDAIYCVLNTKAKRELGILGKEVVLPKYKKTNRQVLKLIKSGVDGYYIPQIDKDGLVVSKGRGLDHFDVNFVAVSSEDVTKEQLMEYFKAPFGDYANNPESEALIEGIIEACKEAYKSMALNDDVYKKVRDIIHDCMLYYPLSFAEIKDSGGPKPPPVKVPLGPPKPKYGLRKIRDSRVDVEEAGETVKASTTRVMEVYEL